LKHRAGSLADKTPQNRLVFCPWTPFLSFSFFIPFLQHASTGGCLYAALTFVPGSKSTVNHYNTASRHNQYSMPLRLETYHVIHKPFFTKTSVRFCLSFLPTK
jgi:hypothetical protein